MTYGIRLLAPALVALTLSPAAGSGQVTATADSLLGAGDFAAAIEAYEAVLDADSTVGVAWFRRGRALQRTDRYRESLSSFHRSLALGGPAVVALELARSHAHLSQADSAVHWLEQAVSGGAGTVPQVDSIAGLVGLLDSERVVAVRATADRSARPCEYDENYRQLDFWLGSWTVVDGNGLPQGTNRIEKMANGCMLFESWTNTAGVTGHSINYYDGAKQKYVQTWVGGGGGVIHVEGNLDDEGVMVFEGEIRGATGTTTPFRGRWSLLDDGRVRQFLESSADGGATWTVWFDGYYSRVDDRHTGQGAVEEVGG